MLFLKKVIHLLTKKSRSNMQVSWTTTESHRFSSTFKILLFVSMPP